MFLNVHILNSVLLLFGLRKISVRCHGRVVPVSGGRERLAYNGILILRSDAALTRTTVQFLSMVIFAA